MSRYFPDLFRDMARDAREREVAANELQPLDPVVERLKVRLAKGDAYIELMDQRAASAARHMKEADIAEARFIKQRAQEAAERQRLRDRKDAEARRRYQASLQQV